MAKTKKRAVDSYPIRVSKAVLDEMYKEKGSWRETPDKILRKKFGIPAKEHWTKRP